MTLEQAQENLNKAIDAYNASLSGIKEYTTPAGTTIKKQDPETLRKQIDHWRGVVNALSDKEQGKASRVGGIRFIQGVGK